MKVLIADDDKRIRDTVKGILEKAGHAIEVAQSGLEAIRMAGTHRPAVIILDGLMPEMHGFEVSRFLRCLDAAYHPVIIILTAIYKGTKYQSEARLRYGVDAYLHKPLQEVELMNAIDRLAA